MSDVIERLAAEVQAQNVRLRDIETWRNEQDTFTAVRAERDRHLDRRFDKIESDVAEIKGYLLKIVWVVILGVLGSFVTFVIRGGLNAPI